MKTLPTFFISHGGGPWPFMPELKQRYQKTADWLARLPSTLPSPPKAILSISSHWEESEFTVATSAWPPMLYDYSGFPEHTYKIKYSAPGSPTLAAQVQVLLKNSEIEVRPDSSRGFDHGTFVPLSLMYPEADIPIVSMSIKSGYSAIDHFRVGEALKPLRDDGVLIVGSGLTFHNMRMFNQAGGAISVEFQKWLTDTVTETNSQQRKQKLMQWESAPSARLAHPYEDHLIPLLVVSGAASADQGHEVLTDVVGGISMASYRFG